MNAAAQPPLWHLRDANSVTRFGNTIAIDYDAHTELLNRGRIGEAYVGNQLPRMREAFFQDGYKPT